MPPDRAYVNRKYIARGLFSEIYSAECTPADVPAAAPPRLVALKITCPDDERAPHDSTKELALLRRFSQDRKDSNKSGARYIVELLDSFREREGIDDMLVQVLPYLPRTLEHVLAEHRKPVMNMDLGDSTALVARWKNKMPPRFARQIVWQLASALDYLHAQGIIHRDLKPHNILFPPASSSSPFPDLRLADFGIAWAPPDNGGAELPESKYTDAGSGPYRAPELLFGVRAYGTGVDMWALGCVAAQLYARDAGGALFWTETARASDIALIATIFETLGAPTAESWPVSTNAFALSLFTNLFFFRKRRGSIVLRTWTFRSSARPRPLRSSCRSRHPCSRQRSCRVCSRTSPRRGSPRTCCSRARTSME